MATNPSWGGARKSCGRPKGSKNKMTIERERFRQDKLEACKTQGISPLEFMLNAMRNEENSPEFRFEAAKQAAPYIHSKRQSVSHSGAITVEATTLTDDELAAIIAAGDAEETDTGTEIAQLH